MDAPSGSAGFEESDELQHLRRRAYGPDADIGADAAAQARLSELETAERRGATPIAGSAPTSVPQPVNMAPTEHESRGGSVTVHDPAEGPPAESRPIGGGPAAPWWRRRWFAISSGALAALILIVAGIVWMSQPQADEPAAVPTETSMATVQRLPAGLGQGSYVPAPDFVLGPESVAAQPFDPHGILELLGVSLDEMRRYENFQGLNVWSSESRYGLTCLFVAVPGQGIREGLSGEGCSLKGLDTSVDLPPIGGDGLLRFVLRGDHVNVYTYEVGADPNASER